MLYLFAATGHINYAKSARLHLQNMLNLKNTHPWVYGQFTEGYFHTVKQIEKFWAGVCTDLIVKQVIMWSIKSSAELTRGRGITESTRQLWLQSMHKCAEIHNATGELTGAYSNTREQHVEFSCSQILRDNNDWFDVHFPFDEDGLRLKRLSS